MGCFTKRDENDMNGRSVFENDMSRCSVFGGGGKNEMERFVRFLILEIFAGFLIK